MNRILEIITIQDNFHFALTGFSQFDICFKFKIAYNFKADKINLHLVLLCLSDDDGNNDNEGKLFLPI